MENDESTITVTNAVSSVTHCNTLLLVPYLPSRVSVLCGSRQPPPIHNQHGSRGIQNYAWLVYSIKVKQDNIKQCQ